MIVAGFSYREYQSDVEVIDLSKADSSCFKPLNYPFPRVNVVGTFIDG